MLEWTWEQWQWRGTPHSPKLQYYGSLTIRLFNVISRTLAEGVLPLCRDAVGVYYRLSRLCHHQIYLFRITSSGDTWGFKSLNADPRQLTNRKILFVTKIAAIQEARVAELQVSHLKFRVREVKRLGDIIFKTKRWQLQKKIAKFFFYSKIKFWTGLMLPFSIYTI